MESGTGVGHATAHHLVHSLKHAGSGARAEALGKCSATQCLLSWTASSMVVLKKLQALPPPSLIMTSMLVDELCSCV